MNSGYEITKDFDTICRCNLETYVNGVSRLAHLGAVVRFCTCIRIVFGGGLCSCLSLSLVMVVVVVTDIYTVFEVDTQFFVQDMQPFITDICCLRPGKCVLCYKRSVVLFCE